MNICVSITELEDEMFGTHSAFMSSIVQPKTAAITFLSIYQVRDKSILTSDAVFNSTSFSFICKVTRQKLMCFLLALWRIFYCFTNWKPPQFFPYYMYLINTYKQTHAHIYISNIVLFALSFQRMICSPKVGVRPSHIPAVPVKNKKKGNPNSCMHTRLCACVCTEKCFL